MKVKDEIKNIYKLNKFDKLWISQEAEQDIKWNTHCICKEKTGPITDEEKKSWVYVYQMLKNIDIDKLYDNVKFFKNEDEEILPIHKRKEEVYQENYDF